ncbi:MAG: site-specific DNA-methyltransferase [Phycisphaeraceae bacterium]|nr:site-specific DNA-methyltransferase [Phycisphaeraceae bacterium]
MPRPRAASTQPATAAQGRARNAPKADRPTAPAAKASRVRNGQRVGSSGAPTPPPPPRVNAAGEAVPERVLHGEKGLDNEARVYVGDCRALLPLIPEVKRSRVNLIFADPPFNWNRGYDAWNDAMEDDDYITFTRDWLDLCIGALVPGGSLWVNIPDDWAAEIVVHLKGRGMSMANWCIWHYRFGQNTTERFINSKVHALYFIKPGAPHTWNPMDVLELSDRATVYADPRTLTKRDGFPPGHRVPFDVWYGQYFGRVQGNNKERRHYHDNQLPEAYLDRVVRACSNPGDIVLDPFLGSGTTGVMARALGRRFIGTEYSLVNAHNACERMLAGPVARSAGPASSAIAPARPLGPRSRARMKALLDSPKTEGVFTPRT